MPENNQSEELDLRDESMMSLAEMVDEIIEPFDEQGDESMAIELVGIGIDMPVQIQATIAADGKVVLGITPPLYRIETSFSTVYHQIRFTCERE